MSETMKIGLDANGIVGNATELGSFGRTLATALAATADMELLLYAADAGQEDLRKQVAESDTLHYHYPQGSQLLGKARWQTKGIVKQMADDGIQLYHGLMGQLPEGLAKAGIRSVVNIHDVDFISHPEFYTATEVKTLTKVFQQTVAEADSIVAPSECTRSAICSLADIDPARVEVIPPCCDPRFSTEPNMRMVWYVREKYELPDRYVLSVGTIDERHNIMQAVKALQTLPDDLSLLVVGSITDYTDSVWDYVDHHGLHDRVVMLHHTPGEHLPAMYRMAEAFVYPARHDAFALPVAEAVSMGLPVVACTGAGTEEAGGPHSLYVRPDDDSAMANAIAEVLTGAQGRQKRIESGLTYASRFKSSETARHYAALYRRLLEESGKSPTDE